MIDSQDLVPERDPGRWMVLTAAIVAVLATVLDGALMGLIVNHLHIRPKSKSN